MRLYNILTNKLQQPTLLHATSPIEAVLLLAECADSGNTSWPLGVWHMVVSENRDPNIAS